MAAYRKYLLTMTFVWGGCFVAFLLAYLLVLSPQRAERAKMEQQYAEKKKGYEAVVVASQEDTKLRLTQDVEQMKDRLHSYAVETDGLANLLFDISRIAAEKQVASLATKTLEDTTGSSSQNTVKFLRESNIEIRFQSDFEQFAMFLNALERHHPIIFVDRFKIVRGEGKDVGHNTDMDLTVFVRKKLES